MLFRKSTPKARFAGWAFIDLVVLFSVLAVKVPAVGLAGLGTVLILSAILVEANHELIWKQYKKNYKKTKDPVHEMFNRPNELYNKLNVYVIWPVIFLLGLMSIYAAYLISR